MPSAALFPRHARVQDWEIWSAVLSTLEALLGKDRSGPGCLSQLTQAPRLPCWLGYHGLSSVGPPAEICLPCFPSRSKHPSTSKGRILIARIINATLDSGWGSCIPEPGCHRCHPKDNSLRSEAMLGWGPGSGDSFLTASQASSWQLYLPFSGRDNRGTAALKGEGEPLLRSAAALCSSCTTCRASSELNSPNLDPG